MAELSAAQRSKIRRLARPKELAPDEEGGELNIIPFLDIIVNILIFVLATVVTTFTSTIETNPPAGRSSGVRSAVPKDALSLTVLIVKDGFSLKRSGGNVAPGCTGAGSGLAIPKKGNHYDFAALNKCAAKLKAGNPAFAEESQVGLGANFDITYGTIIATMDALRNTPDGKNELFVDVNFQVSK